MSRFVISSIIYDHSHLLRSISGLVFFITKRRIVLSLEAGKKTTSMLRKHHINSESWPTDGHVKLGCGLIKLLTAMAYMQPPLDQLSNMHPAFVYRAPNTLRNTKYRVNKRVLNVTESIRFDRGTLACLVNLEYVTLTEKYNIEDESEIHKWIWKLGAIKWQEAFRVL